MVFMGYPSETEITYGTSTYACVMAGDPLVCTITVPVALTGVSQTLPFAITVATGVTEIPTASYAVRATLHAPAPAYGTLGRDLAFIEATLPVSSGFLVTGSFSMQGRTTRAGIPVTLTWGSALVTYGPSTPTSNQVSNNFSLTLLYGGNYTLTTMQPRYLNVTAGKTITGLAGNHTMTTALQLKGGNAYWKSDATTLDNKIDESDAAVVGNQYGAAGFDTTIGNNGDCNFDNIVNIQDLALVGGNYDLQSYQNTADGIFLPAYPTWMP